MEPDEDTQYALSLLTDEERAAMTDELSEHEKTALAAVAAAAKDDGEDEDEDPPAAAPAAAAAAAAAPAGAPTPAAAPVEAPAAAPAPAAEAPAAAPAPAPTAEPAPAPRPRVDTGYHAELPADFDDRVRKLAADRADLDKRLEDGEITVKEFTAANSQLQDQRDELNSLRVKAEISTESRAQSHEQRWLHAVEDHAERAKREDGIDYATDEAKRGDLDTFVKALAANPANEDKSMDWFLTEAHRRVKALHGVAATPAPAPAPTPAAAPAAATPAAPAPRTPPVAAAPITLAHVPGGDHPGDTGDEFADLDALDGDKLEQKLARMTPDQRQRYLAG